MIYLSILSHSGFVIDRRPSAVVPLVEPIAFHCQKILAHTASSAIPRSLQGS